VIRKYKNLQRIFKHQQMNQWLLNWKKIYAKTKRLNLSDVQNDWCAYDFLNALRTMNLSFVFERKTILNHEMNQSKFSTSIRDLLEEFLSNLIDWRKNELLTAVFSNLGGKSISLYRNSLYNLIYWFLISWFIEISLRIEIFDRHETLFFWSRCFRASLSLRSDLIKIAYSSSSSLTSRRSRKSINMKEIISTWMIVKRLNSKSIYWWRNWRYESSQISRCDSWSNRSCMKNWIMMWWDKYQLIRSDDQIIWSFNLFRKD
jgi:hypothetical protein